MARLSQEQLIEKYKMLNSYEDDAFSKGIKIVAGIDEAGRGPLAGPVVAGICVLNPDRPILGLDDSKKLSAKKREDLYKEIIENALAYSVIRIEPDVIDEINILNATKRAMRLCVESLSIRPELLLIDAVNLDGTGVPVTPIIKGDSLSNSIAAASILAKVTRDHIMVDYDRQFPGYGFASHKGYGTAAHYKAIRELGFTPIHRKSFLKVIH